MVPRSHLQLLSLPGQPPGSAGFKLTGLARDGSGVCRVWLRRVSAWDRYPDPRFSSDEWDVRAYRRTDSAFALIEEFSPPSLDDLAKVYAFDTPADALAGLSLNGDLVHDTVLRWALRTLGAAEPAPAAPPAAESPSAPESAPATAPEPASATAPEPASDPAQAPTPKPVLAVEASHDDAWDELAELADRATGAHRITPEDAKD